jgi:ATP-dependent Clp protease ATP-binding subunit ClpA
MRPVRRQSSQAFEDRRVTDEALEAAVRLSDRYITGRFLPDKAIECHGRSGRASTL